MLNVQHNECTRQDNVIWLLTVAFQLIHERRNRLASSSCRDKENLQDTLQLNLVLTKSMVLTKRIGALWHIKQYFETAEPVYNEFLYLVRYTQYCEVRQKLKNKCCFLENSMLTTFLPKMQRYPDGCTPVVIGKYCVRGNNAKKARETATVTLCGGTHQTILWLLHDILCLVQPHRFVMFLLIFVLSQPPPR